MEHTYYIAKHKKVYGTHKGDREVIAFLYAKYMLHETGYIGRQDGVSLANGKNEHIELNNRIRICISQPRVCIKCEFKNDPDKRNCDSCGLEMESHKSTAKISDTYGDSIVSLAE